MSSSEKKKFAIVLLDTMWHPHRAGMPVPEWFQINDQNHSGRVLYKLLEGWEFLVGNSCPVYGGRASQHCEPSSSWVGKCLASARNLQARGNPSLLIAGGIVAKATLSHWIKLAANNEIYLPPRVLYMPHPAFRGWSAVCREMAKAGINDEAFTNQELLIPRNGQPAWQARTSFVIDGAEVVVE